MNCLGILLLLLALCLAEPKVRELRDWYHHRKEIVHRRRKRRRMIETNLQLFELTGEQYYLDRIAEIRKGA